MWATLTAAVCELTRPMYSSISFGLVPAAVMRVGVLMCVGMAFLRRVNRPRGLQTTDTGLCQRRRRDVHAHYGPAGRRGQQEVEDRNHMSSGAPRPSTIDCSRNHDRRG